MCASVGVAVAPPAFADALTFLSETPLPHIRGASAIEVDDEGRSAIILSDRGGIYAADLLRRPEGRVDIQARALPTKFKGKDLEGLAISPSGSFASFERPAHVRNIATGEALPNHPGFSKLAKNLELEALAADAEGRLVALAEGPEDGRDAFPLYRWDGQDWQELGTLPYIDGFRPVGADFGPGGNLYVLERGFNLLGFRSRISRIDLESRPFTREVLLRTSSGRHGNLEGLSIWQSASNAVCVTMVSDDNFRDIFRSELIEYALTESLALGQSCD